MSLATSKDAVRDRSGGAGLWTLVGPVRRALLLGGVLAVASASVSLVQPLIVRQLVADAGSGGGLDWLTVVALIGLFVLETVFWGAGIYVAGRAAAGLLRSVRVRLAARLLRLEIVEHDRLRSDDLVSRLGNDTTQLGEAIAGALIAILAGAVLIAGSLVFMAVLDPLLLAVTVAAVAVAAALLWWFSPKVQAASEAVQEAVGDLAVEAGRALRPLRTVKAARAEGRVAARIEARATEAYSRSVRLALLESVITPSTLMAMQGAYLVILAVGGARVASGELAVADFVAFLLYLFALTEPLFFTFDGVVGLQKGLGAARRINDIATRPLEPAHAGGAPPSAMRGPAEVRFERVSFAYSEGRPVLCDLTLEVPAGSLTALVGASGAGKTTLLALLEGFYRPDAGRIVLNGVDIEELPLDALRAQSGYVEQDAPVLDGTVRENLLLGRPGASEADLDRAIAEAGCATVLSALPDGLDTQVGEAGVLLSGGQRQRIAIARALVADPPLLLLDEPTSQLDALSEADLRATLEHLRGRRTILVVAHRLATVLAADRIVVLKDGTTQATGTHQHLLEHDATYQSYVKAQDLLSAE
jgi:ABC-type multidrug transport system fused ATPase/permease subunit